MTKSLYILCGVPGSGKTTFVEKLKAKYPWPECIKHISRDNIRFTLLREDDKYFARENDVYNTFVENIQRELDAGMCVIADATHLNIASRQKLLSKLNLNGVLVNAVNILTPLETCLERNALRTGREFVPEDVITSMYKRFNPASFREYDYAAIYNIDANGETRPEQRCGHCVHEVGCTLNIFGSVCKNFKRDAPDGGYYG